MKKMKLRSKYTNSNKIQILIAKIGGILNLVWSFEYNGQESMSLPNFPNERNYSNSIWTMRKSNWSKILGDYYG
jgi:hypothetical protein